MRNVANDTVGHEVRGDSVATEVADVRAEDAEHLVQELLDEGGEFPHVAALADEEEVE